jgi:hypothetical protein
MCDRYGEFGNGRHDFSRSCETPPVVETSTIERRRKTANDWMQIVGSCKYTRPTKKPEKYKDANISLRS